MANQDHQAILRKGVEAWNQWRSDDATLRPDLRGADLYAASLSEADLTGANLSGADLSDADIGGARIGSTIFGNTNLSNLKGIDTVLHRSPSTIGVDTLYESGAGNIPGKFLLGAGIPRDFIDYLPPSLRDDPIQFYSCFISYSSKDDEFAQRLHRDLQASKVRVWFAPDDLKIGDKFGEAIQEAIRVRDKVILILSAQSLTSAWVAKEVRTTLDEEQRRGRLVLFPIRIDDALEDCTDQWAYNLKRERQIGDFSAWKDYNTYKKALDRLLRDLKASEPAPGV